MELGNVFKTGELMHHVVSNTVFDFLSSNYQFCLEKFIFLIYRKKKEDVFQHNLKIDVHGAKNRNELCQTRPFDANAIQQFFQSLKNTGKFYNFKYNNEFEIINSNK